MESIYDKLHFYRFGRKEKKKIIGRVGRLLAGEKGILLAIIFGSFTRRSSVRDIDLCVYSVPTLNLNEVLSLNAKIELDLGLPIDLVELTYLPPSFRLKVLKNGVLVKGSETLLHQLADQAYSELMSWENYSKKASP